MGGDGDWIVSLTLSSLLAISLLSSAVVAATMISYVGRAYAHLVRGETMAIGNPKVQLLLSPSKPAVGDNSTRLNFSILNNDQNKDKKSIFAGLTIKEKTLEKLFINFLVFFLPFLYLQL
jgi:hypothetical protein